MGELGLSGAMLYGRTGTTNADDRMFDELYATAERLHVPLHFHPQIPRPEILQAQYSGLGEVAIGAGNWERLTRASDPSRTSTTARRYE